MNCHSNGSVIIIIIIRDYSSENAYFYVHESKKSYYSLFRTTFFKINNQDSRVIFPSSNAGLATGSNPPAKNLPLFSLKYI